MHIDSLRSRPRDAKEQLPPLRGEEFYRVSVVNGLAEGGPSVSVERCTREDGKVIPAKMDPVRGVLLKIDGPCVVDNDGQVRVMTQGALSLG